MSLDPALRERLVRVLGAAEGNVPLGERLPEDADRLWRRVSRFIEMNLADPGQDIDALELGCYALQLPLSDPPATTGRPPLRQRAERAAELLVGLLGADVDAGRGDVGLLLDRTVRLLQEMPQPSPVLDESKLLADALNLEDFGLTGMVGQAIQSALQGGGVRQVHEGWEKREQYGYWEARLKDGFHFEAVRQMAQRRLENARQFGMMLGEEIREDGG